MDAMKQVPYYHAHLEIRGTTSRDMDLDIAFQFPARAVLTLTQGTVITQARTINGVVMVPSGSPTGNWGPLGSAPETGSLIPTTDLVLHNYNVARNYNWIFQAARDVQAAGTQTVAGTTLTVYRFQLDGSNFGPEAAARLNGDPAGTGEVWIDPATHRIWHVLVVTYVRRLRAAVYLTPTPGGPVTTAIPGALEPLPDQYTLSYDISQFDVPVEVANPPGITAPTYPPGPASAPQPLP
jgi:hypothetical protein